MLQEEQCPVLPAHSGVGRERQHRPREVSEHRGPCRAGPWWSPSPALPTRSHQTPCGVHQTTLLKRGTGTGLQTTAAGAAPQPFSLLSVQQTHTCKGRDSPQTHESTMTNTFCILWISLKKMNFTKEPIKCFSGCNENSAHIIPHKTLTASSPRILCLMAEPSHVGLKYLLHSQKPVQ